MNEELQKCMKDAIKASLRFLDRKSKSVPVPMGMDKEIFIDRDKEQWHLGRVPKLQIDNRVIDHSNEILALPEVISCIKFMSRKIPPQKIGIETKDGKKVDMREYESYLGKSFIIEFILKYLHLKNRFEFDGDVFDRVYQEMEEYIYTDGREIVAIAPLDNFDMEEMEIAGIGDFTIRRLRDEEIKKLINLGLFMRFGVDMGAIGSQWCIEYRKKVDTKGISDDFRIHNDIENIVHIMRMHKTGAVSYYGVLIFPKVWTGVESLGTTPHSRMRIGGKNYILSKRDIGELKILWEQFKNLKKYSFLINAIRRFNFSYNKMFEDRIVDLIISLETLFQEGSGEITYKLSLRCAYFIGNDAEERKKIFENMKKAYKVRSKIVHGDNFSLEEKLLKDIEDYARRAIKKYMNEASKKIDTSSKDSEFRKEIIRKLDAAILKGQSFV